MRTQEIKTERVGSKIVKHTRKHHTSKKNLKYREGEDEFYKDYDEVEILDEFFTKPNYLEDYLD